jgi:hypothetical protein
VSEVHDLHITIGQQYRVWKVPAETDLVGDFPIFIHPECIKGRFVTLTKDELVEIESGEAVTVVVSGKRYKFAGRIDSDGAFALHKVQYLGSDNSSEIVPKGAPLQD